MTTRDEIARIVADEGLEQVSVFEPRAARADEVGIAAVDGGWRVYSTDERAFPRYEHVHESESAARADFLARARAANEYTRLRNARRGAS